MQVDTGCGQESGYLEAYWRHTPHKCITENWNYETQQLMHWWHCFILFSNNCNEEVCWSTCIH